MNNKQLVGTLRRYYATTSPKPTLEEVMRIASSDTACYDPCEYHEGYSFQEPKPKRQRDGDNGGGRVGMSSIFRAGTGSSLSAKRTGGSDKRGASKKESKPPAKRFGNVGASKIGGKKGSQGQGHGAMFSDQVRLA